MKKRCVSDSLACSCDSSSFVAVFSNFCVRVFALSYCVLFCYVWLLCLGFCYFSEEEIEVGEIWGEGRLGGPGRNEGMGNCG